jgi:TetR/AcrR family transcriptional regulator, mexJK operon transcriptional repressor
MKADTIKRRVPRGEKRRAELSCVAEQIFMQHGFSETTMQMIASRAGGSKETLYRHFESKEALFAEIISQRAAQISGPDSALARGGSPRQVLFDLGMTLLRLMMQDEARLLFRVVLAEAQRAPELATIFYEKGPGLTLKTLTTYLRAATRRRELQCAQPLEAAKLFLGAVISHHHLICLIGSMAPLSEAAMRAHARAAVEMFLARYGVEARETR